MIPTPPCWHDKVTMYHKVVCVATLYEPEECEFKCICDGCGEELNFIPDGAYVTESEWLDDIDF